jgi:DNA repair protein RecO (recombination protein O)
MQIGGVVCPECKPPGAATLDAETVELLGSLLAGEWLSVASASDRAKSAASGIVAAYSQWHIERGLRSLNHVERL